MRTPGQASPTDLWLRWHGFFGQIVLEQARMPDEGGVESGGGDIEAGEAVEEAQAEEICPEETPESAEGGLGRIPARSLLKP